LVSSSAAAPPPERRDRRTNEDLDNRSPFQRDRDRFLYTSAFRRLAGVTQVVAADEGHVFHNRLTHSLQVAQVARRVAEKLLDDAAAARILLPDINPDVAEAAAMAHDLGHPPFGHVAEQELNRLATAFGLVDGFEGNAQSFRIVCQLAMRRPEEPGLNLTRATLNAVLKYPWRRHQNPKEPKKWGAYDSEADQFNWARKLTPTTFHRTAEAEIMDWADDVTYSVHDVEDFYRAGLMPLHRAIFDKNERERFQDWVFKQPVPDGYNEPDLRAAFERLPKVWPVLGPYAGTREQRGRLRYLTASLIADYLRAVEARTSPQGTEVTVKPKQRNEVFMLKKLTWYYVIQNPKLATQQHGQRRIIRTLFLSFLRAVRQNDFNLFPISYREQLEAIDPNQLDEEKKVAKTRLVVDVIAGMTERQSVELYGRLTGTSLGSVLDPMLP
jgi:dGTPase